MSNFSAQKTHKIPSMHTTEESSPCMTRATCIHNVSLCASSPGLSSGFARSIRAFQSLWIVEWASRGSSGISSCVAIIRALIVAIVHGSTVCGVPVF